MSEQAPLVTYEEVAKDFGLPILASEPKPSGEPQVILGRYLNALRHVEDLQNLDYGPRGMEFGQAVEKVVRSELEIPDEMPSEGIKINFVGFSSGFAMFGGIALQRGDGLSRLLHSFSAAYEVNVADIVNMCAENYIYRQLGYSFRGQQPNKSHLSWYEAL